MSDNIISNPLSTRGSFLENGNPSLIHVQQDDGPGYINKKEDGIFATRIFKMYNGRILDNGTLDFTDTSIGIGTSRLGTGLYEVDVPIGNIKTVILTPETSSVIMSYTISGTTISITVVDDTSVSIDTVFSFMIRCI